MTEFNAGSVVADFVMDEGKGVAAMRTIGKESEKMKGTVEKQFKQAAEGGAKTFKGMLGDISSEFGKRSNLGLGLKLLAGGGAIAGLNLAAGQFESLAAGVSKMTDEFRRGDVSGAQMAGDLLRSVPILGSVTRGFDELRLAITGERVEMEKDAAYAKQSEDTQAFRKGVLLEAKQITVEWTAKIKELRQEWILLTTAPRLQNLVKTQQEAATSIGELKKKYLLDSGMQTDKGLPGPLIEMQKEYFAVLKNQSTFQARFLNAQAKFNAAKAEYDRYAFPGDQHGYNLGLRVNREKEVLDEATKAVEDNRNKLQNLSGQLDALQQKEKAANKAFTEARSVAMGNEAIKLYQAELPVRIENIKKTFEALRQAFDRGAGGVLLKFTEGVAQELAAKIAPDKFAGKWKDAGEQLRQSLRTPAEEFRDSMANLNALKSHGAISGQDYQRQLNATRNALLDTVSPNTSRLQAEEIGGHTTVTAADQGDTLGEVAKNTDATVEGINKLIDQVAKIPNAPKFTQVSVGG